MSTKIADKFFYVGDLLVIPIMSVSFYVHMYPAVPANVLPMDVKPPFLAITLITLAIVDLYMFRNSH